MKYSDTHTLTRLLCLSPLYLSPSPSLSVSLTLELIHTLINIQKVLCVCSPETGSAFYAMYLLLPFLFAASLCQHNLYQPQLFSFTLSLSLSRSVCVSLSASHLTFSCVDIWKCVAHNFNSICLGTTGLSACLSTCLFALSSHNVPISSCFLFSKCFNQICILVLVVVVADRPDRQTDTQTGSKWRRRRGKVESRVSPKIGFSKYLMCPKRLMNRRARASHSCLSFSLPLLLCLFLFSFFFPPQSADNNDSLTTICTQLCALFRNFSNAAH